MENNDFSVIIAAGGSGKATPKSSSSHGRGIHLFIIHFFLFLNAG